MKKILPYFLVIFFFFFGYFFYLKVASSDELDDLNKKITELQEAMRASQRATAPLQSQLTVLRKNLSDIENRISSIEKDIENKRKIINQGYEDLLKQKEIFNKTVRDYYIKSYSFSPLLTFISTSDASNITKLLAYQKRGADRDRAIITNIAIKISDLEEKKKQLENEEVKLAIIKAKLEPEKQQLEKVIKGAQEYQANLSRQIAELSIRQQQLIAQKLASLNLPRSAGISLTGCVDDRDKDPGFSPRFAFFTYGIPHRVGMNQWGAYGRAKVGQDYKTILSNYYNSVRFECRSFPNNKIKVQGYGEIDLYDYLKGLGEMPESWGNEGAYEALKAQVVAAASYAYSYTNAGNGEICTTQECQVYLGNNKGGKWDQAVEDIKSACGGSGAQMLVSENTNEVIKAWYSSTFGGYSLTSGDVFGGEKPWTKRMQDTVSPIQGSDSFQALLDRSYDKTSPYFYCDWGSRKEYNKTAWLKPQELADIVNVIMLAEKDSGTTKHLSQLDKPNPDGVDTWDAEKVKQELKTRSITPYNSISDVSIDWDRGSGKTTQVSFSGDGGSTTFDGKEFKNFFNLRAPANIQIVGPLYNLEKR